MASFFSSLCLSRTHTDTHKRTHTQYSHELIPKDHNLWTHFHLNWAQIRNQMQRSISGTLCRLNRQTTRKTCCRTARQKIYLGLWIHFWTNMTAFSRNMILTSDLASSFCHFFRKKVKDIHQCIDDCCVGSDSTRALETSLNDLPPKLDHFKLLTDSEAQKLVHYSSTTSCALDPILILHLCF